MTSISEPDIAILDVGHGNSALICDGDGTIVLDAPQGSGVLLETLDWREIRRVSAVLVTHSDADHAGGLLSLLTDPDLAVERVYVNADALNDTELWGTVKAAVRDATRRSKVEVHTELTTSVTGAIDTARLHVEILAPAPALVLGGVGSRARCGRRIERNSMSAVVRVSRKGVEADRGVLFMGDLDDVGLTELLEESADVSATVLVFPHHGGSCGSSDDEAFASRVSAAVAADTVVFSMSRRRHELPRADIVAGIRAELPMATLACTQLSKRCAPDPLESDDEHLGAWPAAGRHTGESCAGTITFEMTSEGVVRLGAHEHASFIERLSERVCRIHAAAPDGSGSAHQGEGVAD